MPPPDYARCAALVAKAPLDVSTNWVVLTGAPSSGKTTILEQFARSGYRTSPDLSRQYIESQVAVGQSSAEVREAALELQQNIFSLMVTNALSLDTSALTFQDYALPDNLVYLRFQSIEPSAEFYRSARMFRYRAVFVFEPLHLQSDVVRTESAADQQALHALTWRVYQELGYNPVAVPVASVQERHRLVMSSLV